MRFLPCRALAFHSGRFPPQALPRGDEPGDAREILAAGTGVVRKWTSSPVIAVLHPGDFDFVHFQDVNVDAVRYGVRAKVSARVAKDRIRFVVEESGPGIPEELRESVLKPIIRLDPARNQDGGSGSAKAGNRAD